LALCKKYDIATVDTELTLNKASKTYTKIDCQFRFSEVNIVGTNWKML